MEKIHMSNCPCRRNTHSLSPNSYVEKQMEWQNFLKALINPTICNCTPLTFDELKLNLSLRTKTSYRHILLTASLPIDYDTKKLQLFTPEILLLTPSVYTWCFEFYGADLQYHPHVHILIKTKAKIDKKRIIARLAKHFNIDNNFVDYKIGNNSKIYQTRLNYLKGVKSNSKSIQLKLDNEFRDKLNLSSYYNI